MKKLSVLSIILIFTIMFGVCSVCAAEKQGVGLYLADSIKSEYSFKSAGMGESGDFKYYYNDKNEAILTEYTGSGGKIVVPASMDGKNVTALGNDLFDYNNSITEAVIEDGIQEIWPSTFGYCRELSKVTIPDSVVHIGGSAFECCKKLNDLKLGSSIESIGDKAFMDCSSLTKVSLPDSLKVIGANVFDGCSELSELTIGSGLEQMGDNAFGKGKWYENLTNETSKEFVMLSDTVLLKYNGKKSSVTIPDGVSVVYSEVFSGNGNISEVVFPDSVKQIGSGALEKCSNLTKVQLPSGLNEISDTVEKIGGSAFNGCKSLKNLSIPSSVSSIESCCFEECESLTSMKIPSSVNQIDESAFKDCSNLSDVELGSNAELDENVFIGTPWLENYIAESKEDLVVLNNAFVRYKGSESKVILPDSVTEIWSGAFDGCTSIKRLSLPDSVSGVNHNVFFKCENLIALDLGGAYAGSWSGSSTGEGYDGPCWIITSGGSSLTHDFVESYNMIWIQDYRRDVTAPKQSSTTGDN